MTSASPVPIMFRHRIMARYGEADMQGIIFNARYLDYADLAMSVYWQGAGLVLLGEGMVSFHAANVTIDFKKPIRPAELIDLCCITERIGERSVTTRIELRGANDGHAHDLRAVVKVVHVCVDLASHRSCPLPREVKDRIRAFDARTEEWLSGEGVRTSDAGGPRGLPR